MKKKLVTGALLCAFGAVAVTGGTLAYFSDTDAEKNTFTVGNVQIDLVEKFDATNAVLKPGDQNTNAINKDVWIQNTGSESAWLWYEWLIPAALDSVDGSTGTNNVVHVNSKGATWDKYWDNAKYAGFVDTKYTGAITKLTTWDHDPEVELGLTQNGPEGFVGTEEIEGVKYNKYLVLYKSPVKSGEFTPQAMDQVYLDSKVDYNGTAYTIGGKVIEYDFSKNVNILVRAYGIQEAGFTNVYDAYKAYVAQTTPAPAE